jgi:hypothetical protein
LLCALPSRSPVQSIVTGGKEQYNPFEGRINPWYMINYQDYEDYFEKLNISKDDGIILLNYLEALALIGIEYLNNKNINELNYD